MILLQAALDYYDEGLNILPAAKYMKNPSAYFPKDKEGNGGWDRFKTERLSREEVEKYFSLATTTGIVLLCGKISGCIVVDDDYYKTGKKIDLESSIEVKTPSGGRHIYFEFNGEENHNISTEDYKCEVQGEGKLVLLPPTKAINKQGQIGQYEWIKEAPFFTLPKLPNLSPYQNIKITESTPITEYMEVEHGSQHNQMVKYMNRLLYQADESTWDSIIWKQIRATASLYNPPYREDMLQRDWEDCKNHVRQKKIEKAAPLTLEQIAQERVEERRLEKIAPKTGFVGLDSLIKGFVPGHIYTVTGMTNVGKTSIATNFAYNVLKQGRRVLYFSFEPGNNIMDYLASIVGRKTYSDVTDEDILNAARVMRGMEIRTKDQVNAVGDIVKTINSMERFDLIVIDHLGYFTSGESNAGIYQEQSNVVKQLSQIAKQNKTAIIQIVHLNKSVKGVPTMVNISGSAAIYQDSTEVIIVSRNKDLVKSTEQVEVFLDTGIITVNKTKCGPNGSVNINFMPMSAYITDAEVIRDWQPAF